MQVKKIIMWNKFANFILQKKVYLLIGVGLFTIIMFYFTLKVEMDYHYTNICPKTDKAYTDNVKFKQVFGDESTGIIVGFEDSTLFELSKFRNLEKLREEIKNIHYITNVLTVKDAINIRSISYDDNNGKTKREFQIYNIFPKKVKNQKELDNLKKEFFNLPFYEELLYNKDRNVFLMLITISPDIIDTPERLPIVAKIKDAVDKFENETNIKTHISGHPYIRSVIMVETKREIAIFTILAGILCVAILFFLFRSPKIIFTTLLIIAVSCFTSLGLMGLMDWKMTILTALIPPLLIVIAIPNTVYIINKYHSETLKHGNKILALQRVISKIGAAVFMANLTTAIGFLSFVVTSNPNLIEFGVAASTGVFTIFISSLIIIPSCFSYWKPPKAKQLQHVDNKFITKYIQTLLQIIEQKRKWVFFVFTIILGLAIYGITQVKEAGYILDDINHEHFLYKDLKFFETNFNGAFPLEILIASKDSLTGLNFINEIEKINNVQNKLNNYSELSKSISVANFTKFLHQAYSKGKIKNYKLPPNPKTYEIILNRLPKLQNNMASAFIDSTRHITRISLHIKDLGTIKMNEFMPKVQAELDSVFSPEKYETFATGSTVMYWKSNTFLTINLFQSLVLAIFIIASFMFWLFRNPKIVLISLVPNLIPMIVTGGIMGFAGIPLKPSTILIFSIAFGISVDATIHYLTKFRQELKKNNLNIRLTVIDAFKEVGRSMLYSSIILILGFLVFAFSNFGGTKALGILVTIALFIATLANSILLPTILYTAANKLSKKSMEKFPEAEEEDE